MEEVSDGAGEATVGRGGQRERHCSLVWLGTVKMYEERRLRLAMNVCKNKSINWDTFK